MNEAKLAEILYDEISKLNDNCRYKRLFTINNNLDQFNIINRALILRQQPKAFDVKSRLQWSIEGKNVREGAKPIFVMNPITDSTYRFSDNGEELRYGALTPTEIANSLQMGLLVKDVSIIGISIDGLFDIRDTENFDFTREIKPDTLKTNIFNLLVVVETLLDVEINRIDSGKIQYFSKSGKLFIPKDTYKNIVDQLVNILIDYIINNSEQYGLDLSAECMNDKLRKLIEETAKFSLKTKFGIIDTVDFSDIISTLKGDELINVAKAVDSIVYVVTSLIPSHSNKEIKSSTQSIRLVKQAENLADIMESNLINSILN